MSLTPTPLDQLETPQTRQVAPAAKPEPAYGYTQPGQPGLGFINPAKPTTNGTSTSAPTNAYGNDPSMTNSMLNAAKTYQSMQSSALPKPTTGSNPGSLDYMDSAKVGFSNAPANSSGSPSISKPDAPTYNPFAMPGDRYGDDKFRQANYESLLSQAASERGWGGSKRAAAKINAAQQLLAPGLASIQARSNDYKSQMDLYNQQMQQGMTGSPGSMAGINAMADYYNGLSQAFQNGNNGGQTETPKKTPVSSVAPSGSTPPGISSGTSATKPAAPAQASSYGNTYWKPVSDATSALSMIG